MLTGHVLRDDVNLDLTDFIDDLLHIKVQESVERVDLLGDQTMLTKVASNYGPGIILIDVDLWFLFRDVELWGAMLLLDIVFHLDF